MMKESKSYKIYLDVCWKTIMTTQHEIIKKGYKALVDSLGVVDAIRFIQYFSSGKGDYTKERHQWLEQKSLEDVFREIEQFKQNDLSQYDEIIEG